MAMIWTDEQEKGVRQAVNKFVKLPGLDIREEALSIARLGVIEKMDKYDPERGSIGAFAYWEAVNALGSWSKRDKAKNEQKTARIETHIYETELTALDMETAIDERIDAIKRAEMLTDAINDLDDKPKHIVKCLIVDGMTFADIAAETGTTKQNVQQICRRAAKKLATVAKRKKMNRDSQRR